MLEFYFMRKPHFFKAKSRLGLINKPNRMPELNLGVELGPDAILDGNFLDIFENATVSNFHFPSPETISKEDFLNVLAQNILNFKNLINLNLKKSQMQIVVGGDHSVSLASFLAVLERAADVEKVGYLHFDSHGDINLFKDSPSQNFHGMYLRPLFDKFDIEAIDKLVPVKLTPNNLLIVGNLDLDKGEKDFIEKNNIQTISQDNFELENEKYLKIFTEFVGRFEYLHVSFDGDVLDKSIFKATGIPAEHGFLLSEVLTLIKILAKHKKLSFDVCEFNPKKDGATESKIIVQKILKEIIFSSQ